jgi:GPH family glycoside/pentoside/hexuronide:cation symporter
MDDRDKHTPQGTLTATGGLEPPIVSGGDTTRPPGRWQRLKDWYSHRVHPDEPSRKELVSYSTGVICPASAIGVDTFSTQIWVMNLGLDPRIMGIIAGIKTLWDGINDTLFGHITDNWRGRWGRRRPFIAIGGVLYGLLLIAYWWFDPGWGMKQLLLWYTAALFLMEGALTVFGVPYYALAVELSPSYTGRTRVVAYRETAARVLFFFTGWIKPIAFLGVFGGLIYGARAICAVLGVLAIVTSLYTAVTCRERFHLSKERKKEPFLKAVAGTAHNRHFWRLVLMGIVLGVSGVLFNQFALYLTVGYVFGGDQPREAMFSAVLSLFNNTVALFALPLCARISRYLGKHRTLALTMLAMIVSCLLKPVCIVPGNPYLLVFLMLFGVFGQKGANMMIASMMADVLDVDELNSGHRREGLFGGVASVIGKTSTSVAVAVSGFVLVISGYQAHLKLSQSPETFQNMLWIASLGPAVCLALALCFLWRYPLTRARMDEVRAELERRRGAG